MDILVEIKSKKNNFTKTEKSLADFIIGHAEEVVYMSIYQIADTIETSIPTVTRFVKKLGYDGFRDFKIALASEVTLRKDDNSSSKIPDSDIALVDKLFSMNIDNLQATKSLLETDKLIDLCKKIKKSKRVVLFGVGASSLVAQYAALRFAHIDIQAETFNDDIMMLLNAKRLDKKCVAIGISHSGRTAIVIKAIELAKKNNATTVCISNYLDSPLSRICDYLFCTAYPEDKVSSAALSSHIAQLAIIDTMFLLLAQNIADSWDREEIDKIIEELVRV